jgi:hypothetical protein
MAIAEEPDREMDPIGWSEWRVDRQNEVIAELAVQVRELRVEVAALIADSPNYKSLLDAVRQVPVRLMHGLTTVWGVVVLILAIGAAVVAVQFAPQKYGVVRGGQGAIIWRLDRGSGQILLCRADAGCRVVALGAGEALEPAASSPEQR